MPKRLAIGLSAALAAIACNGRERRSLPPPSYAPSYIPAPAPPQLPAFVHLTLTGVLIGPTKPDGREWDCCADAGAVSEAAKAVAVAMTRANPYVGALAALSGPIAKGVVPPDPFGKATIYASGMFGPAIDLPRNQDSYSPGWSYRWHNVPLQPTTSLTVEVWDADLEKHDKVGTFMINYGHLVEALRSGGVLQVPIQSQDMHAILFAGVSVVPAM